MTDEECQKNVKEVSTVVKYQEIVCYLHMIMKNNLFRYLLPLLILLTFGCGDKTNHPSEEHIKVVLREVGNQLLLANKDSTSLVLPIIALDASQYRLLFQKPLSFEPNDLVEIFRTHFQNYQLSEDYRVEVVQCKDKEVAYSYEMSANEENTIIPCSNRTLPDQCYTIDVQLHYGLARK